MVEGEVCGLAEQKGLQMPRGSNTRQKLLSESTVDRSTGLAGSLGLFVDAVPGFEDVGVPAVNAPEPAH
ncbi:hypothetical protein RRG08_052627 [Elysia crispata]|uniref:Uncharacterized protein n=1 Tax=Elysia crispata TaxID=231223 RepID=A0AAE1AFJ2_9GAST|nr:hypothetical protein RRG08_052627 [Elysia crispata]